nr:homogentisate 1,2-dioxygenase [Tanacetum cinerariifolium]
MKGYDIIIKFSCIILCLTYSWLYRIKPSVTHEPFKPRLPKHGKLTLLMGCTLYVGLAVLSFDMVSPFTCILQTSLWKTVLSAMRMVTS